MLPTAVTLTLATSASAAVAPEGALDGRAWEMVSPAEKNGGEVGAPAGEGAGAVQAAAGGGAVAFGSDASFGEAVGAAPVSQYLAGRGVGGWSSVDLTPPLLSGTYAGGAYQLFSGDLGRALLSSGWRCRDGGAGCAAENPPLAPGVPAGYRTLYLREGGEYRSLLTTANSPALTLAPEDFQLALAGASPDLRHAVVSTCAALTGDATEVPGPDGCDPAAANLYEWSEGTLSLVNLLPGEVAGTPGASLAAPAGAVSADGSRVYWNDLASGNLYLRAGAQTKRLDESAGGGGTFQAAASDGSIAYFTKAEHLYRFDASTAAATDLTPGGGVVGTLGASDDGSYLYYLAASGLFLWHAGASAKVAAGADPSNLPAATGTAQLSADGTRLAFVSSASLTGYANGGKSEVFLYEAAAKKLLCVSCNPKGTAPLGPSTLPGASAAGDGPATYRPRALSADGTRLFFDSADALVPADTGKSPDVYEWEAQGSGSCQKAGGCLGLISSGRSPAGASFADASASGADAYFLTAASLLPADTGALDLYDARAGGGFAEPPPPIPCEGDDCQGPAPGPNDPDPATATVQGPPNPPPRFAKPRRRGKHRGAGKHRHRGHRHRGARGNGSRG